MSQVFWFLLLSLMGPESAQNRLEIEFEIPAIKAATYHRPYVAIWLESEQREGIHTLAVWHEGTEWLKDMRQWWRSMGRKKQPSYDGVTGATRKPGNYRIHWDGADIHGQAIPPGTYYLHIEVAREKGGRDHVQQKVHWGNTPGQSYTLQGALELGKVIITLN